MLDQDCNATTKHYDYQTSLYFAVLGSYAQQLACYNIQQLLICMFRVPFPTNPSEVCKLDCGVASVFLLFTATRWHIFTENETLLPPLLKEIPVHMAWQGILGQI